MAPKRLPEMAHGIAVAFFVGVLVLLVPACWFSPGPSERIPAEIQTRKNPVALSGAVLALARKAYAENCVQCHGAGGKGDGPMSGMYKDRPADLTNPGVLAASTDGEIYWRITKGERPMPSFEKVLSDEERWRLVHLMRFLSNTEPNTTLRK